MTNQSPTLRLVHLSDLHLVEEGKLLRNVMDTPARMRQALDKVVTLDPAAIIVSGDIGQRNHNVHDDVAAYFGHFQENLGIPFITIGDNHDPIDSIDTTCNPTKIATVPELCDTVHNDDGIRIIRIDYHVD